MKEARRPVRKLRPAKREARAPKQAVREPRVRRPARSRQAARGQTFSLESFTRLDRSAVIFLIFFVCLIHWAIRVFLAPVYTIEEADQLLMSQSLQLGYTARQPPLVAWLHALAAQGGGVNGPGVFAIKYALLTVALSVYYLAARNVLVRPGVSAAALGAWALTFVVGWGVHEDLLNGVSLMAGLSLTLHALTRILTWRRKRDWTYLGVAMGLGLLTSHLFVIFPIALLSAVFFTPFFRDAVKPAQLATALIVAAIIYAPYGAWLFTHVERIADVARDFAATWEIDNGWFDRAGLGAVNLGRALLEFTLPLSLFWATLFWPMWLPVLYPIFARLSTDEEQHEAAWRSLFARSMMTAAAVFLIGVLMGVRVYKDYWMLPVLYTLPLWMFSHVKRTGEFPVAIRAFAGLVVVFIAVVIGGRFIERRVEIAACDEPGCRPYAPVAAWTAQIEDMGFTNGTLVGADRHLTGNIRALAPRLRVMDASLPAAAFPEPFGRGGCLAVWRDTTVMPDALADYLEYDLQAPPHDRGPDGAIRRNLLESDEKAATLYFQFVSPSERCR